MDVNLPSGVYLFCVIHPFTAERIHPPDEKGRGKFFVGIDGFSPTIDSYDDDASLKDLPRAIEAFLSVVNKMGAA